MKNHSGQVALVMVLIMTVVSAVAVSLASRTTVETRIQEMNVESKKALLTAQAGLEEAISKNQAVTGELGEGRGYDVSVSDTGVSSVTSEQVGPGEGLEINVEGGTGLTGVSIYWKPAVPGQRPALFITDVQTNQNVDYAYDSEGLNGFTKVSVGGSFEGVNYDYKTAEITVTPNSKRIRVTVLGAAAFLGVQPVGGILPPQSTEFRSVADVTSGETKVRYGIEYTQSKTNQLPSVFDYALFSNGTIVQ